MRHSIALHVLALLLVTGFAAPADAAEDTPPLVLEIVGGALAPGAPKVIRVTEGEPVALPWRADEPTEIHLHGYDVTLKIEPGRDSILSFDANAAGRYPITLHRHEGHGGGHGDAPLLYIDVYPR